MYGVMLLAHSWVRWLVVLLGLWAVATAASGMPTRARARASLFFTIALDVQLLLGVLLYVALSPITRAAMADIGAAMRNSAWRFWTVEHPALMILAVVFGHVGKMTSRPGSGAGEGTATARASRAPLAWFALALLAILAAMPWPFLSYGRPLLRW